LLDKNSRCSTVDRMHLGASQAKRLPKTQMHSVRLLKPVCHSLGPWELLAACL